MASIVDFGQVSTSGLESSPVAEALAGLRANEARYFKNKYDHVFTEEVARCSGDRCQHLTIGGHWFARNRREGCSKHRTAPNRWNFGGSTQCDRRYFHSVAHFGAGGGRTMQHEGQVGPSIRHAWHNEEEQHGRPESSGGN
jgi:hypothetical protein